MGQRAGGQRTATQESLADHRIILPLAYGFAAGQLGVGSRRCQAWGFCAVVGLQWSTWHLNMSSLHLVVELLGDIVQNCSLEDSQIEKERDVILREMQENDASMRDVVFDYLHATAFQGTPLAQTVEGPSENVR